MTCTIIDERIISRYLVVEDLVRKKECTGVLPSAASKFGIFSQQARRHLDLTTCQYFNISPCKTNSCKNFVKM